MKKNLKIAKEKIANLNNKGITLIALVVTIVVLLILAAITINAVLSEGGIFNTAKNSQRTLTKAEENERLYIIMQNYKILQYDPTQAGKTLKEVLESEKINGEGLFSEVEYLETAKLAKVTFNNSGNQYTVLEDGTVIEGVFDAIVTTSDELRNELSTAVDGEEKIIKLAAGTYTGIFIIGHKDEIALEPLSTNDKVIIYGELLGDTYSTVTCRNLQFDYPEEDVTTMTGADNYLITVRNFTDCCFGAYAGESATFENCTFNVGDGENGSNIGIGSARWGCTILKVKDSIFNCNGMNGIRVDIESENTRIEVEGCTFNDQYKQALDVFGISASGATVIFRNNNIINPGKTSGHTEICRGVRTPRMNTTNYNLTIIASGNTGISFHAIKDNSTYWEQTLDLTNCTEPFYTEEEIEG